MNYEKNVNTDVVLSGWVNKKRDHGNLLFIDLRDNYGITQCIIDKDNQHFNQLEKIQLETVIRIKGKVVNRTQETINKEIASGEIEISINPLIFLALVKNYHCQFLVIKNIQRI